MRKQVSYVSWEKYLRAKKVQISVCMIGWLIFFAFTIFCLIRIIPVIEMKTEVLLLIFVFSLLVELTLSIPNTILNSYRNYSDAWNKWIFLCYERMPNFVKKRIERYRLKRVDMQPTEALSLMAKRLRNIGYIFLCIAILAEVARIALLIYLIKTNIFYAIAYNNAMAKFSL